jgi:hypothetical protein
MQPAQDDGSVTPLPRTKNAEFVAFRVSQDDPGLGTLADVSICRSKSNQSCDLSFLVLWPEIEVKPVLARLGLAYRNKQKSRKSSFARSYFELVGLVVDNNPPERGLPPAAKGHRICRVNVDLLPFESHALSIGATGSQNFQCSRSEQRFESRAERRPSGMRRAVPGAENFAPLAVGGVAH